jgi:hypothetical protein
MELLRRSPWDIYREIILREYSVITDWLLYHYGVSFAVSFGVSTGRFKVITLS